MAKPTAAQKALPRHGFEVSRGLLSRAVAALLGSRKRRACVSCPAFMWLAPSAHLAPALAALLAWPARWISM